MTNQQPFVAREPELAQLTTYLDRALGGQGQVCFIAGEPGQGKTTLALEFARRAQERHPDLAAAVGLCDPQTGQGDPYLPWRTVLQTLTATGSQPAPETPRWKKITHASAEFLLDWGPDLVGAFVPGASLAAQIGVDLAKKAKLTDRLLGRQQDDSPTITPRVEQNQIFQQYVNVVTKLAAEFPLLLVLDDAQWADNSSLDLLFYLVRRIQASRLLIVVTYREAELELGRRGERHPLLKVVAEVKRYFGDVTIDLARCSGPDFVKAYLDREPNKLDVAFRSAVYQHTGGNPLFVVELLRDMQERGDLVRDAAGDWVPGPQLDWSRLPGRAEGVIEERITRLPEDLRQVLQTASVQGRNFAAEVVAQVQDADARPFVHRLNSDLVRRHRLLQALGQERVGEQRLSHFAFQNNIFQQYLYHGLNPAERAYLHEDIARALEALYGDEAATIAVQLAWHYEQAGNRCQARRYLRLAGEQALAGSAPTEADDYFTQALALTGEAEVAERWVLLLAREEAYDLQGAREAQRADLEALAALAPKLGDPLAQADAALRRARYGINTADYPAAIAAAREALAQTEAAGDPGRQAASERWWGEALWHQGQFDAARPRIEAALDRARQAGDRQTEAECRRHLGIVKMYTGDPAGGQADYEQALALCRQIGDRLGEAYALVNLAEVCRVVGDYAQVLIYAEQGLVMCREVEIRGLEVQALGSLSTARRHLGQGAAALEPAQQALALAQELGDWETERYALLAVGGALFDLEQVEKARAAYQEALDRARAHESRELEAFALAGLAETALVKGVPEQAAAHAAGLLPLLAGAPITSELSDVALLYWAGYRALAAGGDERAGAVLRAGYHYVTTAAAQIADEAVRRSYLENVPANRDVLALAAGVWPGGVSDEAVDLAALFPPPEPEAAAPAVPVAEASGEGEPITGKAAAPAPPQPVQPVQPVPLAAPATHIDLRGAGLAGAVLNGCNLAGCCLVGADLRGAQLRTANLRGADLRGADLRKASLGAADLRGADLRSADLRGAQLCGADLTDALANAETRWPKGWSQRDG